ncbi:Isoquinoline 1-oxidoreductase subunit [Sphingomonas spermidinifaciens]|uniref:Isoquinoline 1-oxidoreductase subunit n=1 Tax=Sphingomonas spermidinifaciens TaxID=1141889 RepID=A0A2A4B770_9SPHN|nr:Isoquinoline 1-oxidoreductase subunit [Sphingomonas spermidinifaciens]PCD04311.1 Isoquinoline 1-oxidoreductase subunit [Sphingomonas spermidinifaciens]
MSTRRRRRPRIGCLSLIAIVGAALLLALAVLLRPRSLPQPTALAVGAPAAAPRTALRSPASFMAIADPRARSIALFREAGRVIQHPRCLNCHPRTDRPTQTDAMRPHMPWVSRGAGEAVLPCATCHHDRNVEAAGVPGNPGWQLAPSEMAWQGQSLGDICRQLIDPARSHMTRAELLDHMATDDLVGWAWHPGGERTPAPGTQAQFGALIDAWLSTGAQCPA